VGVGVDYMDSKIQLERFIPAGATTPLNVAQIRIKSDLMDSSGLGWNAGLMWRSSPSPTGPCASFGVSYRSEIEVDHEGTADFQVLFPTVAPPTSHDVDATIEFPASLNIGAAYRTAGGMTIAFDADRTDWSSFSELEVQVTGLPPQPPRVTDWDDSWAYRTGVEVPLRGLTFRAGYYKDSTPQPLFDVGPVLPDADRDGYTVGLGIPVGPVTVDLAYVYVRFDDRTTSAAGTDRLAGTWKTIGNELAFNVHWQR
jgi:long-chain fatty acid transport protein